MPLSAGASLRLALPKGRMQDAVVRLLADAGIDLRSGARGYRPTLSLPGFETKVLKPQNIVEMLHLGSRDVGFAGADWVAELDADLVELLDTGLDPVRIVAAAPTTLLVGGRLPSDRPVVVASEYERLTRAWIGRAGLNATVVRSFGATLEANGLAIIDELMRSSTRLYAHPRSLDDPARRAALDSLVLLLRSVLEARTRVMLEVNVARAQLEALVAILPCMREPTIAPLHGDIGFAVKAAVPRRELPVLIPRIKAVGGTDIVVSALSQLVP